MRSRRARLWTALVAALATPAVANADDLASLSLEELMSVEVRPASYVVADREVQPVSITVIDREQIRTSGARTVNELLALHVPGYFLVEDQDDVIAAFRGFAPDNNSKVLLLLDGRPLNTEWFAGPPDAILNGLDLGFIDRIEIIRGPGSVMHGPGALLGVINIVTRRPQGRHTAAAAVTVGADELRAARLEGGFATGDLAALFYLSSSRYGGQALRGQGWALIEPRGGGVPAINHGHRLKAAEQDVALALVRWRDVSLQLLRVWQLRDNYNFFRDREELEQQLTALSLGWTLGVGSFSLQLRGGYDHDELGQLSHDGIRLAGTREDRYSAFAVLRGEPIPHNRFAVGADLRHFEMGLRDRYGLNLLVNRSIDRATASNVTHTYVNRSRLTEIGLFVEDAHQLTEWLRTVIGLRIDVHPFWGPSTSPRLALLATPRPELEFRISYQTGFRGAPGAHYTGGWRHDGLLQEDGFGAIEDNPTAAASGYQNIRETEPERLRTVELAAEARPAQGLTLSAVSFASWMRKVIDVGVIFLEDQPDFETAGPASRVIGDDLIGDWGGWFFFKNNPGQISTAGLEMSVRYSHRFVRATASHALVRMVDSSNGAAALGSMYVSGSASDPHFRAYPEDITRLSVVVLPWRGLELAATGLRFGDWYSPDWSMGGADGESGLWLNAYVGYRFASESELSISVKNVLDMKGLWPMNSNASGPAVSPGAPALEGRTLWVTAGHAF